MNNNLILFDFDGVIVDSFGAAFAVNKMIHPLLKEDAYRRRFEGNINESVVEEDIKSVKNEGIDFFAEYRPLLMKCALFPGMKELIEEVSRRKTLVIVSSTTTDLIKDRLAPAGIDRCFADVMGNDVHKSKIAKIRMALEKHNVGPERSVFVTDTLGDIKEAHHVGIRSIGVSWGFQAAETLARGNPYKIVGTVQELNVAIADA